MASFWNPRGVKAPRRANGTPGTRTRRRLELDALERRIVLSYAFSYNPVTHMATAIGDAATDALIISPIGGLLEHDVNGTGFSSDWGGGATVPAANTETVNVTLSSGDGSSLQLGGGAGGGPASGLFAAFNVVAPVANTTDTTTIDDSGGTTPGTYTVATQAGTITGPGINYDQFASFAFGGGVTLKGADMDGQTYDVRSVLHPVTSPAEPMTVIAGNSGSSTVNVGNAGKLSIGSPLAISSTGSSTTLNINDSGQTTAQTYTIAGSKVTATSSPSAIDFSGGGVTELNLSSAGLGDTFDFTGPVQSDVSIYRFSADGGAGPNTLNVTSSVTTVDFATAGLLRFGTGNPTINYANFQVINVTKPASSPVGTGVAITANTGQPLDNVLVATFTESDLGNGPGDFNAMIDWGDSTTSPGTIQPSGPNSYNILGSHTYSTTGTHTINVTLTDLGSTGTTTVVGTTVHVTSNGPVSSTPDPIVSSASVAAAPLTAQGATVTGSEGGPLNPTSGGGVVVATFMDTGAPGRPTDYSASIDWGDSSTSPPPPGSVSITSQGTPNGVVFIVSADHTYAEEGVYSVYVTISNNVSGAVAIASGQAVISDAALTATTATALTATTGQAIPSTATIGSFTDANTTAPPSDFTATIDWGDGSPPSIGSVVDGATAGTFDVEASHVYTRPGTYSPSIVVHDVGGSTITLATPNTASITVTDAAPTGTVNPVSAVEGIDTGSIVLATITVPNPSATAASLSATVDWGDGTGTLPAALTMIGGTATTTIFQVTGSHTYAEAGTKTVSIAVTTTGGATTTPASPLTTTATIADAPITASGTSISGVEGTTTPGAIIATFSDANPAATVADFTTGTGSVTVDWGDGVTETLPAAAITASGTANGLLFTVKGTHKYAEAGHYQLTVTINDTDGATASANGQAVIADAALTPSATQPTVATTEDQVFSGPVGSFADGNTAATIADYTYVMIDWGDGTPQTAGAVVATSTAGTFNITGTHTYDDAGVNGGIGHYPVTIDVHDIDGATTTITNTANVADVPLTITGRLNPGSDSGVSSSDNITNVVQPTFIGATNQPNATITLYAQPVGGSPSPIGRGVSDASGGWSILSNRALADGAYVITAIAVDSSGHTISSTTSIVPNLVIDTVGPKVTSLSFNRFQGRIVATFQDYGGQNNAGVGLVAASIADANNYQLVKVHHPRVGQYRVNVISDVPGTTTGTQTATLSINKGHYIPGGWYFFTIRSLSPLSASGIRDVAGNAMDGEFYGYYPSGNNVPGGNFVAQLTAIHHTIYAPSSVIGRATPVSPRGTRQGNVFVPTTVNPSTFSHAAATANRSKAVRPHVALVHHSAPAMSRPIRQAGGPMVATSTPSSTGGRPMAMGALGTIDQALDQLDTSHKHRKS